MNHIYDDSDKKLSLDALLQKDRIKRNKTLRNKLGRLTQSNITNVCCNDAMDFIDPYSIPSSQKIAYANFICDYRPLKPEKWRTGFVVGGDKLPYYDDAQSPAANLLEYKILFNSVISHAHPGA